MEANYIIILVYILGLLPSYLISRFYIKKMWNKYTNADMIFSMLMSLLSWVNFLLVILFLIPFMLPKNEWFKKDSKF